MGGEPTVRKDLFQIIRLVRKSGNYPILFTNGLKLADNLYVKKLKKSGIRQVILSFDGFDPSVYRLMGREQEYFLKLLALRNLEAERIPTFISMRVIKGVNEKEIKKIINFGVKSARAYGVVKGIIFSAATITKDGRYLLPKETEISARELLEKIERNEKSIKMEYLIEFKKLLLNLYNLFKKVGYPIPISSGGFVGFYRVGSLKELIPLEKLKEINEIWRKNKILALLKTLAIIGLDIVKMILFPFQYLLDSNIFIISVGNINNPNSHKLWYECSCVGIEKNKKIKPIKTMIQGFYYTEGP
jgi:MoaA/NifB/PqqE/SkfB family radical SAM enzyme